MKKEPQQPSGLPPSPSSQQSKKETKGGSSKKKTTSFDVPLENDSAPPPPPPPPTSRPTRRRRRRRKVAHPSMRTRLHLSSLDFERVVNDFSIDATKQRLGLLEEDEDEYENNGNDQSMWDPKWRDDDDDEEDSSLLPRRSQTKKDTISGTKNGAKKNDYGSTAQELTQRRGNQNGDSKDFDIDKNTNNPNINPKKQKSHLKGRKRRAWTRWALSACVGLVTGWIAILLVSTTSAIVHWRIAFLDHLAQRSTSNMSWLPSFLLQEENLDQDQDHRHVYGMLLVFGLYLVGNLVLALLASWLCIWHQHQTSNQTGGTPPATGSGIPEVKAYLNGVRVQRFSNGPLLLVKVVGTVLSVSSGLAVGMEGPLIHIGAIVGASFTKVAGVLSKALAYAYRWTLPKEDDDDDPSLITNNTGKSPASPRITASTSIRKHVVQPLWIWTTTHLAHFSIDAERRDLVTIGASVGFAASFGAPLGGLLFVLDDISSYFGKSMLLRTLVANAIGVFCLAVFHGKQLSNYSVINLGSTTTFFATTMERDDDAVRSAFGEVPLYALVGIGGGILGGIFCSCFEWMQRQRASSSAVTNHVSRLQLTEVALLSLLTSVLLFFVPMLAWTCTELDETDPRLTILEGKDWPRQFFCAEGQVNELATILFGSRDVAIKRILSDPTSFQQRTLWAVAALFYGLMTLTYGSILPSGIFTPAVLVGASFGGACGMVFQDFINPDIMPANFALVGVAAFLAGIQRSTVSLCVILVEGTGQIKALFPSIIAVLIARYVASFIHTLGIYETSMELKKYPFLDHNERRSYDIFQVADVMMSPVITVGPREKALTLVKLLRRHSHNGFPVVDPKTKKFLGLVRRDQIVALLECGVFEDVIGDSSSHRSGRSRLSSFDSTSSPGSVSDSPLMHWAYHIKDDRYDGLHNQSSSYSLSSGAHHQNRHRKQSYDAVVGVLEDNEFDDYEWLLNIRDTLATMPNDMARGGKPAAEQREDSLLLPESSTNKTEKGASQAPTPVGCDDSLPPIQNMAGAAGGARKSVSRPSTLDRSSSTASDQSTDNQPPVGFATVGCTADGNVVVCWLNPDYEKDYVNLAAVMNKGTFGVPEFCPLSKVRYLFTRLGLRWIIVLGGESGGEVVGMVSRYNLLPSFIEERTGIAL